MATCINRSRRDHCKCLIHDYAVWSNTALHCPLFIWTEDAQCSLNTSKATFIQRARCYVGLLLWRSLSPCHWDGQLWPCHREEPFLSLPPAWGSQQGFLPHNAKNKVVIHSLWERRKLTKFKKWPKCTSLWHCSGCSQWPSIGDCSLCVIAGLLPSSLSEGLHSER